MRPRTWRARAHFRRGMWCLALQPGRDPGAEPLLSTLDRLERLTQLRAGDRGERLRVDQVVGLALVRDQLGVMLEALAHDRVDRVGERIRLRSLQSADAGDRLDAVERRRDRH